MLQHRRTSVPYHISYINLTLPVQVNYMNKDRIITPVQVRYNVIQQVKLHKVYHILKEVPEHT